MTDYEGIVDVATAAVEEVAVNPGNLGLTWELKPGSVISSDPLTVMYDGDSEAIGMTSMIGPVDPGARVFAVTVPPAGQFIIGSTGNPQLLTGSVRFDAGSPTAGNSTTSGVLAGLVGPGSSPFEVTIEKKHQATSLRIDVTGSMYATGATAQPGFAINVTGVGGVNGGGVFTLNHVLVILPVANGLLNTRTPWAGNLVLGGLDAGTAVVALQWNRGAGAGTLNIDSNDYLSMIVTEVWPA